MLLVASQTHSEREKGRAHSPHACDLAPLPPTHDDLIPITLTHAPASASLPLPPQPHPSQITGITGQDGSYLAELLLSKGYVVHGIIRRSSSFNTGRINHIYKDRHMTGVQLFLHYGDLTDSTNLCQIVTSIRPVEIYNLGAQSHVKVSFDQSEYTANVDGIGCLRLLNAMRMAGLTETCKFYQASTSELYGKVREVPQSETTPFYPRSPYAVAKQVSACAYIFFTGM